jgi:NADH-quinone oxidoreductase subunit H
MALASALIVVMFLGGWTLPVFGLNEVAHTIWGGLVHVAVFVAKMCAVMFVAIWVRWMWPRFRYDQLMNLGWRRLLPLALANVVVTAGWLWLQAVMQ